MTKNFKIIIEYDGSAYSGWQVQNDVLTVQYELERALSTILNRQIRVTGSGRTDAGVHATHQVANFHADTDMEPDALKKAVNSLIKGPVTVMDCRIVDEGFHARYDAVGKTYHYHISNRPEPIAIGRNYVWHIGKELQLAPMQECCMMIAGRHDFKSFEGVGSPRSSTIREVYSAAVERREKGGIVFKISANGFLRYMVRNIVGTVVQAGLLKSSPEEFREILSARDRRLAGPTAPPRGLFLMKVTY
ncbi:MAG: tRNA pseudouridine(38-40) synthase TruA [Desulfarculaceae bacterium]|nr:tRNA pseudouridine(38-40) synthase TruA [Desulfarculaceae bacterium]